MTARSSARAESRFQIHGRAGERSSRLAFAARNRYPSMESNDSSIPMIDTATGRLLLDGVHSIRPSLERAAFLRSRLARRAKSIGVAAAWPRFFIGPHTIFDDTCSVTLEFHEQRLEAVSFVVLDRRA